MKSGQPVRVLRRSSRICAARQKSNPTPIKTNAVMTTDSISTPREPSPALPQPEKSLDSLTSESQSHRDEQIRTSLTLEESFASQMTLDEIPSTPHNPEPAIDSRMRHNIITYKRQRTMRTRPASIVSETQFASPATIPSSALSRSVPLSQPVPGSTTLSQATPSPSLDQPEPSLVALSQPEPSFIPDQPIPLSQSSSFHGTQSSAPSCSPIPAHVSHRRKRRRRLPPLKNRLARVARRRLPRESPAPLLGQAQPSEDSEYGEEELVREEEETRPAPVNVTQRRLAAPENFTLPDLKDLFGRKSQAQPPRTPAPRFVLPQNTIHPPRFTQGPKSPYSKRKPTQTPRLKFVALEAHHVQATVRSGNANTRLPLTPQSSPVRRPFVFPRKEEMEDPVQNFSNRRPEPSPCRVFVKATPELESPASKLPSLAGVMSTRLTPEPEVEAQPSRSLAPMSELYDNLLKLAKSAQQMSGPANPESSNLKRKLQATLTPQLTFEVTQPTKVARLQ
ncbi:unnamed protein product [Rhizoctonia solani]|uniref:Uncharacterized protein n=3 Tax=Rhizoctonia solani TaxID=456999 RepID=A0A8H2XM55_9AGAM|nr:hypothetical protein RSOL_207000 [Rhizoctonia solani AG-3 Rhs1AP]KEP53076.1 hypothetical protein V565_036080 [Rhizoctonia solani 123E]CAE6425667.1 unnamed protein product [Rhizoctonia solani]CAE6505510.1 unnamed protein product [Rhizoctonia solani]